MLELARALNADIYTGFVDYKNTFEDIKEANVFEIGKFAKNLPSGMRIIYLMRKFRKLRLNHDFFIFSGTICITAAENNKPNILYCHTPPRYIYDLRDWYDKHSSVLTRIGLWLLRRYVYEKDQCCMRQFDRIITNSKNVQNRLRKYYGKKVYDKSDVIYSFIEYAKFRWQKPEDFYLSIGRLDKLKRIDIIIDAFKKMPDKKLVVISSGPELDNLKMLAQGCGNIQIRGWVSEDEKIDLMSRCIATIYIPLNEDMGLSVLETFAAGKPCIAANEGGLRELITDGKDGLLIEADSGSLMNAVKHMTPSVAARMKANCIRKTKIFSEKTFMEKLKKMTRDVLKNRSFKNF